MSGTRKSEDTIHGIDTRELKEAGAKVYPLRQQEALKGSQFPDGLCLGLTASLMRRLSAGELDATARYQNPLPDDVREEAIGLTQEAIQKYKDGKVAMEQIAFGKQRSEQISTSVSEVKKFLSTSTSAAILTYKTKGGDNHTLLFFKKGFKKCVIQDANRFTIDNLDVEEGKRVLVDIIERSDPKTVAISRLNRRASCKL